MKILTDTGLVAFWNKIKQLILGNRPYNPSEFSGKGYKVLEKNIQTVDGVKKNILTAVMLSEANTIYEIRYDFDLNGETIEIQEGCTLKFCGGSLKNGTLTFTNTEIIGTKNIFDKCYFGGDIIGNEVCISWFGINCKPGYDDALIINNIIQICDKNCVTIIFDHWADMYISKPFNGVIQEGYDKNFNNINCGKHTHIIQKSLFWIILQGPSKFGAVIRAEPGSNCKVENLLVDANNISHVYYGENGIAGVRYVKNCHIKNCRIGDKEESTLDGSVYPNWGYGGKGIQCELNNLEMTVENSLIENCKFGIFCTNQYTDSAQKGIVYKINKCNVINCAIAFMGVNLKSTISSTGDMYNRISVTNCIFDRTTGTDGVICLAALNYVLFSNIFITGSNTANSLFRGCTSKSTFRDIEINQPSSTIFDFSSPKDNPEVEDIVDVSFDFRIYKTFEYLFKNTENVITHYGKYKNNVQYARFKIYSLLVPTNSTLEIYNSNVSITNTYVDILLNDYFFRGNFGDLQRASLNKLTALASIGYLCVGDTSKRPTFLNGGSSGYCYFDTTLNKPIYWTGTKWVDATGTDV